MWPVFPLTKQKLTDLDTYDPERVLIYHGAHLPICNFVGDNWSGCRSEASKLLRKNKDMHFRCLAHSKDNQKIPGWSGERKTDDTGKGSYRVEPGNGGGKSTGGGKSSNAPPTNSH